MSTTATTFRTTFVRLTSCLPIFAAVVAVTWFGASHAMEPKLDAGTDAEIMQLRPSAEGSPAALIAEHGCWTGKAPADMQGVVPGHVVVTVDGVTRVGGSRAVGAALEQVFEGVDHGLTVHGFCR